MLRIVTAIESPALVRRIYHADLFDILPELGASSIDACVTDPPYGLEFMGKEWDDLSSVDTRQPNDPTFHKSGAGPYDRATVRHSSAPSYGGTAAKSMQRWHELWAEEVWRVLKPGGYLTAFGGTRTFHRLACAIEDAGFEIRDCLSWMYGTGFPKSLNVSKAIDEAAGAEREVVGSMVRPILPNGRGHGRDKDGRPIEIGLLNAHEGSHEIDVTAPATEAAKQWEGWGTALKPGWEPIILARKPLRGTVAENVLKYGTGALNIDACRIGTDVIKTSGDLSAFGRRKFDQGYRPEVRISQIDPTNHTGRWPANVVLDEEAALQLNAQTGDLGTSAGGRNANISKTFAIYGGGKGLGQELSADEVRGDPGYGDSGGASRFFYTAKASRSERDQGCGALPATTGGEATDRVDGTEGLNSPRAGAGRTGGSKNLHPTVKPVSLMQWLVKLVTPPGGIVLDPFLGSGSTAMACMKEGVGYIGIEKDEQYVTIARHRVNHYRVGKKDV